MADVFDCEEDLLRNKLTLLVFCDFIILYGLIECCVNHTVTQILKGVIEGLRKPVWLETNKDNCVGLSNWLRFNLGESC